MSKTFKRLCPNKIYANESYETKKIQISRPVVTKKNLNTGFNKQSGLS